MKYLKYYENIDPFEDVWEDEEMEFFGQKKVEIDQPGDLSDIILWDGIKEIRFSNEDITKLPDLPDSIEYLGCSFTNIFFLPKLPKLLECLYCYHTKISFLSELPKSLEYLFCSFTNIKEIPKKFYDKQDRYWLRINKVKKI